MPASSSGSGPTPESAPSSAPDAARQGSFPLVLAVAAAAACWNPLGAPFALAVGAAAAILAVRALRRGARRRAAVTLALGVAAALASVLVLLSAVGLGARPEEKLGVEPRPATEVEKLLDEAGARTREARERARRELEQLPPGGGTRPPPAKR